MGDIHLIGGLSVQDRDLLGRLNQYFDSIEDRLREGQGWFIFAATGGRAKRVTKYIADRLAEYQPLLSYYFVPWRDFALNAYMQEIELAAKLEEKVAGEVAEKVRQEYDIATRVSRDTYYVMAACDMLVISGLAPSYIHELRFLDKLLEGRYNRRYPTILLTPRQLTELSADFQAVDPANQYWGRLFTRMYERSLIAV